MRDGAAVNFRGAGGLSVGIDLPGWGHWPVAAGGAGCVEGSCGSWGAAPPEGGQKPSSRAGEVSAIFSPSPGTVLCGFVKFRFGDLARFQGPEVSEQVDSARLLWRWLTLCASASALAARLVCTSTSSFTIGSPNGSVSLGAPRRA